MMPFRFRSDRRIDLDDDVRLASKAANVHTFEIRRWRGQVGGGILLSVCGSDRRLERTTEPVNGRSLSPGLPFSRSPEHLVQIIKTSLASGFKQVCWT